MDTPKSMKPADKAPPPTVLTPNMVSRAKVIAADKKKSVALLKRAGIVDKQGNLAKEYTN